MNVVDNGTFMYVKHVKLVKLNSSRGRIYSKASTKHLESRLEVIQGHTFWDH